MTSAEVCRRTGLSYRQLDHWCRSGRVPGQPVNPPRGPGGRSFTSTQVRFITLAARLKDAGLSLTIACDAAQRVLEHHVNRLHLGPGLELHIEVE